MVAIGDRVKFSNQFLRGIYCYSGEMFSARGTVVKLEVHPSKEFEHVRIAYVKWDDEPAGVPIKVLTGYLSRNEPV